MITKSPSRNWQWLVFEACLLKTQIDFTLFGNRVPREASLLKENWEMDKF